MQSGLWSDGNFVGDKISDGVFGAPKNIVVTDESDNENKIARISWDAVPDAEKYEFNVYFDPDLKESQANMEIEGIYNTTVFRNIKDDYTYYLTLRAVDEKDGKETYSDWTYIIFKRSSEGEYEYYSGGFKDGKKDGQGKITYVGGAVYEGEWKDDVYNGQGKFYYTTGDVYDGEWKDSKYNGQGKLTYADGSVKTGVWEDGNFVG